MTRLSFPTSLALCWMWLLVGDVQVFAFPLKIRRDLFPVKEVLLNMALTSFDDQYKGCVELMEAELAELNRTEFVANRVYAEAWAEAASMWRERKASFLGSSTLKPEHAIALMAYTVQGRFHKDFNAAVREAGRTRDDYLNRFPFKTFHFLLTRALHLLGVTAQPRCHKVYRGVRNVRFSSERSKAVRFGQFTSSSRSNESALKFGTDSFVTIETCYGVNIQNYSFFPSEEEVLIPPFEKFRVVNFTKGHETNFIHLLSLEDASIYNCLFVKEKTCKTQRCPFSTGGSWSPFSAEGRALLLLWGPLLAVGLLGPPGLL
ncbi:erythroblast NAD(P)(+)--arginine ADP-ribosyltransferase-like [Crotalus tigris]|uniref:erythroblast NAD(P)(+)--arginine ADP-ribosyltransferase-like n=1 Tax=Crotalus tigris TaxID=88082 RepID=UPI00192FB32D|nr:erythroblast NAD(P)(+)--arginine ADP-ribosyltransferase-like [Crotalus tigris]XP_039225709.1 erythroblast NAD(P)(+)--arginine ADP-ribosyltransferase-like [Crotalus tigris]